MIAVNVRGPCGGGKSTAIRTFIIEQCADLCLPLYAKGRRMPVGYLAKPTWRHRSVFVLGHYEREAMGGGDTFRTLDQMYGVIAQYAAQYDVLWEGKTQSRDVWYLGELAELTGSKVHAVSLQTTADQAVQGVRGRASACDIRSDLIQRTWRKCRRDEEAIRLDRRLRLHLIEREGAQALLRGLFA